MSSETCPRCGCQVYDPIIGFVKIHNTENCGGVLRQGAIIQLGELPYRARFYFLNDKKKEVWEVNGPGENSPTTTIVTGKPVFVKQLITKDSNLKCVFLRVAPENEVWGRAPRHN